jgi:hypothetical protein
MSSVLRRRGLIAAGFVLALAAALMVPTLAIGETGDFDNPVQLTALPWSHDETGSLVATTWADLDWDWYTYDYLVPVVKGQTVAFTSTVPPEDDDSYMSLYAPFDTPLDVDSKPLGDGAQQLTFMAPRTADYTLTIYGSEVETFSLSGAIVATQKYKMTSLSVPGGKKGRSFTASVKVWPVYNSLLSPVRFKVQRKVGKKWRAHSTVMGTIPGSDSTYSFALPYSKFSAKMRIKRTGTFRIRAKFADAAHSKATFTGWKTIKVR